VLYAMYYNIKTSSKHCIITFHVLYAMYFNITRDVFTVL